MRDRQANGGRSVALRIALRFALSDSLSVAPGVRLVLGTVKF